MQRVGVLAAVGALVAMWSPSSASALPPFSKEWVGKYVTGNPSKEFVAAADAARCNVCHAGASKKEHNEYGQAVKKYITKNGYNAVKGIPAAAAKYIQDGITAAEGDTNAAGQKFGELIKAGKLPGAP
jgi:hypothetical protein